MRITDEMKTVIAGAVFGIVGVVVGALLTTSLQERADRARAHQELLMAEFREGEGAADSGGMLMSLTRVLVTASPKTVKSIASLVNEYPECISTESRAEAGTSIDHCRAYFVGTLQIVREELGLARVDDADLDAAVKVMWGRAMADET